jgi:hypothetical protein
MNQSAVGEEKAAAEAPKGSGKRCSTSDLEVVGNYEVVGSV